MENFGVPTDEQWTKMKQFIKSDKYKKDDFFVFETIAVGDKIVPHRFQRLMPDALEVMKQDALKGVSLMLNHNEGQLGVQSIPIGKVFDARIGSSTQEGETTSLYVTQYILRDDSKVDGYSKNDIINLVETGILADTSVGFTFASESAKCSICGNSYFSGKCSHWRGGKYIVDEETNAVETCILLIHAPHELHAGNNMLIENSVVFDGAYPNAVIQSALGDTIDINSKLSSLGEKEKVELQENSKILGYSNKDSFDLLYKPAEKGGKAMEKEKLNTEAVEEQKTEVDSVEETTTKTEQATEQVATQTTETEPETTETETQKVEVEEQLSKVSFQDSELSEIFGNEEVSKESLLKYARDGKLYRENIINEALKSGVRSMGNAFNQDSFAKTFELMSTEDIKAMGEAWEKDVSTKFNTGNRVSAPVEKNKVVKPEVDYSNYKTSNYII